MIIDHDKRIPTWRPNANFVLQFHVVRMPVQVFYLAVHRDALHPLRIVVYEDAVRSGPVFA